MGSGNARRLRTRRLALASALLPLVSLPVVAIAASECGQSAGQAGVADAAVDSVTEPGADAPAMDAVQGASDAGGASATDGSFDDAGVAACATFAQAYCTEALTCIPVDFHRAWFGTTGNCIADMQASCALELASPGTSMTPANMVRCAQAISAQSCAQFTTAPAPECIAPGTLANDAGCEFSSQCQSTLCDVGESFCGVCAPRAAAGSTCLQRGDLRWSRCQSGLLCTQFGCAAPVADGGTCQQLSNECAPPLVCLQSQCGPAVPDGGRCFAWDNCLGDTTCLYQSAGMSACVPLVYAPIGSACDIATTGVCVAGANCEGPDGGSVVTGTCTAALPSGHACTYNDECVPPLKCIKSACQAAPPASACP